MYRRVSGNRLGKTNLERLNRDPITQSLASGPIPAADVALYLAQLAFDPCDSLLDHGNGLGPGLEDLGRVTRVEGFRMAFFRCQPALSFA